MAAPTAASGQRGARQRERRPWPVRILIGLLVFQGVGAVGGGAVMMADPSGRAMGWDTGLLENAPFASFLWPGVILGLGLGMGSLVIAFGVLRRPQWRLLAFVERWTGQHWSWAGSIGLGIGLVAWIVVQLSVMEFRSFLQPFMFAVGAALVGVPLLAAVRRYLV